MQLLSTIDAEALMDAKFPKTKFCVETLLPDGICILGGVPKIGKSWWVIDLCIRIAFGCTSANETGRAVACTHYKFKLYWRF